MLKKSCYIYYRTQFCKFYFQFLTTQLVLIKLVLFYQDAASKRAAYQLDLKKQIDEQHRIKEERKRHEK